MSRSTAAPSESDEDEDDSKTSDGPGAMAADATLTPDQRIENSIWLNTVIGVGGLIYLVLYFSSLEEGVLSGTTLNTVNFIFLFLGILLAPFFF